MGAKSKPDIDPAKVERLAAQGLTVEQICSVIGISTSTFYKYKSLQKDIADAHKRGQYSGIDEVTNLLMEQAREGNITAQIFYLKNRAKDQWRDKWDIEHSGGTENTITIVDTGTGHVGPASKDD